eukprot:1141633-Pelagomonas_calceolata.AAC.1
MARLVERMASVDSPAHNLEDSEESVISTLKLFAQLTVLLLARSDQNSIRTAGGGSSLIRNAGVKERVPVRYWKTVRFIWVEASLILSNRICTFVPSYSSMRSDLIEKDMTLRGAGKV